MAIDIEEQSLSGSNKFKDGPDMESPPQTNNRSTKRIRKRCICLWITIVILVIGLIALILGLTVFKVKQPVTGIESVTVRDFNLQVLSLRLNLTLGLNVSVYNPNRIGFQYQDSNAILRYRGNDVGDVQIPAGSIGARDTRLLDLNLTLMADRLLADSNAIRDLLKGVLPFQTYVRMKGKVRIVFAFHVTAYSTCNFSVFLGNQTVTDQDCSLKTKL